MIVKTFSKILLVDTPRQSKVSRLTILREQNLVKWDKPLFWAHTQFITTCAMTLIWMEQTLVFKATRFIIVSVDVSPFMEAMAFILR